MSVAQASVIFPLSRTMPVRPPQSFHAAATIVALRSAFSFTRPFCAPASQPMLSDALDGPNVTASTCDTGAPGSSGPPCTR